MTRLKEPLIAFVVSCALAFAGAAYLGSLMDAKAQPTVLGPWANSFSVTNGAVVQIAPSNPTRRAFEICNGAAGSLVYVLPALNAAGTAVNPTTASGIPIASNACFIPPANLLASGSAASGGQIWNAIASGATAVVAFIEW